ncbi:MAG: branched-chain amino acid ABC transporter permease [Deltaproteobacteria bacterium]|nr:branched-chain amino acid ABC transporter permease [Deltaproteobacteria bacterium]
MLQRLLKILFLFISLLLLQFLFPYFLNAYVIQILCLLGINVILALGLNLINGMTGQFSLGHAGFMAIGAYGAAFVSTLCGATLLRHLAFLHPAYAQTLVFLIALGFGALLAALAGLLVGIPTLRLKGDYLAIATLGFGEIIRVLITNFEWLGAAKGLGGIPEYSNLFWIFLFATLTFIVLKNLLSSSKGMALLAIREDEIAAASMGIDCSRFKIMAFTLGAFIAGLGGGLYAHLMSYLHPNSFTFMKSVEYVVMIVLGGTGSLTGTVIAATLLTFLPELLRFIPAIHLGDTTLNLSDSRMIIYALLLILIMIGRSNKSPLPLRERVRERGKIN